jgi:hypothetical protein
MRSLAEGDGLKKLLEVIPSQRLENPDLVQAAFDNIEPLLIPAGRAHIFPFHYGYGNTTRVVRSGLGTGVFDNDEDVAANIASFAKSHFDPLAESVAAELDDRESRMKLAWKVLYEDERAKSASNGVQFSLGMITHIDVDLPESLAMNKVGEDYWPDFKKVVGAHLAISGNELSELFIPQGLTRPVLRAAVLQAVAIRRARSFKNGQYLISKGLETADGIHKKDKLDALTARLNSTILSIGNTALKWQVADDMFMDAVAARALSLEADIDLSTLPLNDPLQP